MTPYLVISGGQSGADLAGNEAAHRAGIPTRVRVFSGFCPIGRIGIPSHIPIELLPDIHGTYTQRLLLRTYANVEYADKTIVFIEQPLERTKGSRRTVDRCALRLKPFFIVRLDRGCDQDQVNRFVRDCGILNVAGSRGCDEASVSQILLEAFGGEKDLTVKPKTRILKKGGRGDG